MISIGSSWASGGGAVSAFMRRFESPLRRLENFTSVLQKGQIGDLKGYWFLSFMSTAKEMMFSLRLKINTVNSYGKQICYK